METPDTLKLPPDAIPGSDKKDVGTLVAVGVFRYYDGEVLVVETTFAHFSGPADDELVKRLSR